MKLSCFSSSRALAALLGLIVGLPAAFAELKISALRGAGLTDKQGTYNSGKYRESDFRYLASLGANFVRLPVSYVFLTKDGDPSQVDETKLREIDEAVAWGRLYGLHICLNLFATPGYTIAEPKQSPGLWTDESMQKNFIALWQMLAERYRGTPPEALSFNLLNEPAWDVTEDEYAPLMRRAIAAIHATSPDRWIFVDGLKCGTQPVMSLADLPKVAQALHCYEPSAFTHYGASWLEHGGYRLPRPTGWPAPGFTEKLFGPSQAPHSPLVIRGPFPPDSQLVVRLGEAGPGRIGLRVTGDGRELCRLEFSEGWLDQEIRLPIPAGVQELRLMVTDGERLTMREIALATPTQTWKIIPGSTEWEPQSAVLQFDAARGLFADRQFDRQWLHNRIAHAWKPLLEKGTPVMVQEFGCHNQTPHEASLAYLSDCLTVWQDLGLGWAFYTMKDSLGWANNLRSGIPSRKLPDGTTIDTKFEDLARRAFAAD